MEPVVQRRLAKMSKSLKLRALLNERLSAVAEDIFQLFQRTMAEYEEELFGDKDGSNQRRRVTLEQPAMKESDTTRRGGVQMISSSQREDSPIKQENPVQVYIKEDPDLCIKQEEEELLPFTVVSVKVDVKDEEEMSVHDQNAEKRLSRKTDRQTDLDFDCSEEMATPANSSPTQMEEGHSSKALYVIRTPQSLRPHTFHYSDLASAVPNGDRRHPADSPVADSEKEPKLHKCAQCGKEYHHSSSLFRHIHTHREQKPFRCSVCQKGFSQKPHLTAHMRIHTGEKPFSCPFCARTFSNKSNLSQHLRVHTGEKPFACSVCNVRFGCLKTLTTHTRIHTGDRPFACSECDMRFKQQTSLDSHMRTHSGEKPYGCPICQRSFSQRRSLKKHLRGHGQQETPGGGGGDAVRLVSVHSSNTDEISKSYVTVAI